MLENAVTDAFTSTPNTVGKRKSKIKANKKIFLFVLNLITKCHDLILIWYMWDIKIEKC